MSMKPITEFETFKKEFTKWQKLFGLTGYKVYFKYEPVEGGYANITINQDDMVATARLSSECSNNAKPHKDIKRTAKHEAIHLLVGRLELNGCERYTSEAEIYQATEELVFRLEDLIK